MERIERDKIYRKAIYLWGYRAQMSMAEEESLEFAMAIHKDLRKTSVETSQNIVEEFADLEIMMEQIEMIYGKKAFRKLVEYKKIEKINRLKDRMASYDKIDKLVRESIGSRNGE